MGTRERERDTERTGEGAVEKVMMQTSSTGKSSKQVVQL
jgi:hypothetical protein